MIHALLYGKKIRRLADGEALDKATLDSLFTHLRGCERCRRKYDLAMGAERLLHTKGSSMAIPSAVHLDAIAARVIPSATPAAKPMPWLVPALAAGCAALLVVLFVARQPKEQDFGVRAGESAAFTVRVFCDRPGAAPVALDQTPGRCAEGTSYRFAYTSAQACGAEIIAVTDKNERRRVWPEESTPREVPASSALRPLGSSIAAGPEVVRFEISCKSAESLKQVTIPLR